MNHSELQYEARGPLGNIRIDAQANISIDPDAIERLPSIYRDRVTVDNRTEAHLQLLTDMVASMSDSTLRSRMQQLMP